MLGVFVSKKLSNPVIIPEDIVPSKEGYEVIGAFNAGVAGLNGETILLLRVAERPLSADSNIVLSPLYNPESGEVECIPFDKREEGYLFHDPRMIFAAPGSGNKNYLTSISHLRLARSKNGVDFDIEPYPALQAYNEYMTMGIEDPRITQVEDTYYISFSSISHLGITSTLVSTKDFTEYKHIGNIFHPDNKDVVLFPEKIHGRYYAIHRPSTSAFGKPEMWLASSDNISDWGDHRFLAGLREGFWDSARIGAGCPPIKTQAGWLEIYHGATTDNRYCMGALLLDIHNPAKVLARSSQPMIVPDREFECNGFFGGVVFACGHVAQGDSLRIYYGAADESTAMLETKISDILAHLQVQA